MLRMFGLCKSLGKNNFFQLEQNYSTWGWTLAENQKSKGGLGGGSDFYFHKYGAVGKIVGVLLKKGGTTYFHTN